MEKVLELAQQVMEQKDIWLPAIIGLLTAAIGLAMLIPGEQPEKALKSAVDFLSKFSRKPQDPEQK